MSSAVYAGAASVNTGVFIDFDNGVAEGAMWPTRSSDNDVEFIGCSYKGAEEAVLSPFMPWNQPVKQWAWCQAMDPYGAYVACFTKSRNLLDALRAISPFSYIRFEFKNLDARNIGECTRFDFSIQSLHLPDFSTKN
jgi:hypothetical protein